VVAMPYEEAGKPKYFVQIWRVEVEIPGSPGNYMRAPFNSIAYIKVQTDPPTDPPSGYVLDQTYIINGQSAGLSAPVDGGRIDCCYAAYAGTLYLDPWPWRLHSQVEIWAAPETVSDIDVVIKYPLAP